MSQKLGFKLQRRFFKGIFYGSKLGEFPKKTHRFFGDWRSDWSSNLAFPWTKVYSGDELKSPGNGLLPMISFRVKWRWSSSWRAKTTLTRHVIMRFGTWNNGPHGRGDTSFGNDALCEIWVGTTIRYWKMSDMKRRQRIDKYHICVFKSSHFLWNMQLECGH